MRGSKAKCIKHRHEMSDAVYEGKIHRDVLCNDGQRRDRVQVILSDCGRKRYKSAKKAAK